jgi:hypothetical protein
MLGRPAAMAMAADEEGAEAYLSQIGRFCVNSASHSEYNSSSFAYEYPRHMTAKP